MSKYSTKPDFVNMEHEMINFWKDHNCFEKLKDKNKDNKPFRFLDGPITANNPMGIHHAWGRTIKDVFLRYKALNGYSCHYRNGFDAQGLWVEVEVEKELGFKDKRDIEKYGMENFTNKCVERVTKFSGVITEQSKRLGQWMDWENSYYTHTDENIEGIWTFLQKCHQNGWIKQAYRPMPWCPRCGTSLSAHEMSGSYHEVEHTAVYVKLPLKEKPWDMLVWTTTPWTLSSNVALAVNAEIEYAVVNYGGERPLVLAKNALKLLKRKVTVVETFMGSELEGMHYETCFPSLPVQKELDHKIVLWDMVSAEEGCGVVHIAPGCGAEDFELGQNLDLEAICPIDESGTFMEGYDWLTGMKASEAAQLVFDKLEEQGKLFETHKYTHSYPVCWRCKTEVLFRLVQEWYIKTDEIKPRLLKAASEVKWEPEYIGKRMQNWLMNMGDWNISRKRFYGLPLPFYQCKKCGKLTVVGSKEELRNLGGSKVDELPELHRPWIDSVKIKCPHCEAEVSRVSAVGDVWLDAGIVPFTTLGYFKDREKWKSYFPAEWVTEMREQVRLWFYSLLFMSVTLVDKAPYEKVLAYNSVVAEDGTRFSKTGFMIKFDEAAEKIGADTVRYLFAGANVSSDVRFGYNLGEEAKRKLLGFWNVYVFFMTYAELEKPDIENFDFAACTDVTDKWLLVRTNKFIQNSTASLENYKTAEVIDEFEAYVDDISNWYVRCNRRRFWKQEKSKDKLAAYGCLYKALKTAVQVMAPIIPFMTEYMWQNMVRKFERNSEESIHLSSWPVPIPNVEDNDLLKETETVRKVIGLSLKVRNENQLKVKQPLSVMYVNSSSENKTAVSKMLHIVKDELNIKEVEFLNDFSTLNTRYLTLNFKNAGAVFKERVQELKKALDNITYEEMMYIISKFDVGEKANLPSFGDDELEKDLFIEKTKYKENISAASDNDICVALKTDLTEELILEGLYRELLRQCQVLRKEANLRIEQRIVLGIKCSSERMKVVVEKYRENIAEETLALKLMEDIDNPLMVKGVTIGEYEVNLQIGL
ncbi:isoleucine--tRNA ligase [Oceanirhabdus sp. W0125-5]|uniref:isoleucine--tRNA ligase n=1 Tax=Oceanirhabdus sp. W0125-5 TaxID=2999116 RepID=UPI0022F2D9B7|nr:isoleucine--tRNA ligase [Oceanirhabdus sp. W0125-5]WBW94994.1 isoleucine--tRNA ligase [Oceanirhabdus sp. W0125-5]